MASYSLEAVANLASVVKTISHAHWYESARFTVDEKELMIATVIAKHDQAKCGQVTSLEQADECSTSVPYEQLRFSMISGKLISRISMLSSLEQHIKSRQLSILSGASQYVRVPAQLTQAVVPNRAVDSEVILSRGIRCGLFSIRQPDSCWTKSF